MLVRDLKTQKVSARPLWAAWRHPAAVHPDHILNHFQIRQPAVPIRQIAQGMGIVVGSLDIDGESGMARVAHGVAYVYTNPNDAEVRQRFTIAHEIGHLLLHAVDNGPKFRDRQYANFDQNEFQANQFAADLLMPAWMVWRYAAHLGRDANALAAAFHVSPVAMSYRMKTLKML